MNSMYQLWILGALDNTGGLTEMGARGPPFVCLGGGGACAIGPPTLPFVHPPTHAPTHPPIHLASSTLPTPPAHHPPTHHPPT